MDLFNLFVKIFIDTDEYERGLDDASGKTSEFAGKLKNGLASAAKIGATAIAAVTAATTAMTAALVKGVLQTAEYGDNIDKMSQKMGLSAQAYQEWDAIMQHSGTSIESLQAGMKTLANAVESGNDAFGRLGITQEQIASMNNEELFSATISALQNVENETERTYLAGQLLGRGATELGALLNTSAEDTEAMRQRVHELGGVMSDEAVKAAAKFQDSLQDMKTAMSGLSRGLISGFMPSITTIMDGLTELFSGNGDAGISLISQGFNDFVSNISSTAPKMIEIGGQILTSLSSAIIQNIPLLIDSGTQTILSFVTGLVEQLPMIVSTSTEIIATLSSGISESLPELIPTIVDIVIQIVETLIDNVDMLIESALQIIIALAEGLINALPRLIEKAPEIVMSLVTAIISSTPMILDAAVQLIGTFVNGIGESIGSVIEVGENIVKGVWEGIKGMASWFAEQVKGFFSGIVDGVKNVLGIHSPSRVFAGIGENMALGLGKGWDDEYDDIKNKIGRGLEFGTAQVDFASSGLGISSAGIINGISAAQPGAYSARGAMTINLMFPDGTKLASYLFNPMTQFANANGTPILNPT